MGTPNPILFGYPSSSLHCSCWEGEGGQQCSPRLKQLVEQTAACCSHGTPVWYLSLSACSQGRQQLAISPGCSTTRSQELQSPGYKNSLVETRSRCEPIFPFSHPCCFMQEGLAHMVQFPRAPYQSCNHGVCRESGKIS